MSSDQTMEAVVSYYDLPPTAAVVTVQAYDRRVRTLRALRVLGICWGLAAISILIPIAHFLLVPAFFVAGPALAIPKLREAATVVSARGRCPSCGEEQEFSPHASWKPEVSVSCRACRRGLRLVFVTPLAPA